jgi:hypothetical protein
MTPMEPADADNDWKHIKTIADGERCVINDVNIWDHEWTDTGARIQVKDPLYGRNFTLPVYEIQIGQTTAQFAAGEFSNCIWGIYIKAK